MTKSKNRMMSLALVCLIGFQPVAFGAPSTYGEIIAAWFANLKETVSEWMKSMTAEDRKTAMYVAGGTAAVTGAGLVYYLNRRAKRIGLQIEHKDLSKDLAQGSDIGAPLGQLEARALVTSKDQETLEAVKKAAEVTSKDQETAEAVKKAADLFSASTMGFKLNRDEHYISSYGYLSPKALWCFENIDKILRNENLNEVSVLRELIKREEDHLKPQLLLQDIIKDSAFDKDFAQHVGHETAALAVYCDRFFPFYQRPTSPIKLQKWQSNSTYLQGPLAKVIEWSQAKSNALLAEKLAKKQQKNK